MCRGVVTETCFNAGHVLHLTALLGGQVLGHLLFEASLQGHQLVAADGGVVAPGLVPGAFVRDALHQVLLPRGLFRPGRIATLFEKFGGIVQAVCLGDSDGHQRQAFLDTAQDLLLLAGSVSPLKSQIAHI